MCEELCIPTLRLNFLLRGVSWERAGGGGREGPDRIIDAADRFV